MRLVLLLLLFNSFTYGQEKISNKDYLKKFFRASEKKSLLIVGENHASSVGSTIYPNLIEYFNKKNDLNTLLIEFGPAEAYFYSKYLETGNEKHLNYTIYAGSYKGWREAWRKIYKYNKGLEEPLEIIGIDFDRTRTLAYALFSILIKYDEKPDFVEVLLNEIKTDEFYNTYTTGYPTEKDKQWTSNTKELFKKHYWELKLLLSSHDLKIITNILENEGIGYGGERENALAENTQRIIEDSDEQDFLLLIGRSHAYLNQIYNTEKTLSSILIKNSSIRVLTGVILFQNSVLWGGNNSEERIRLFEIKNKIPWKRYYSILNRKAKNDFTIIPSSKDLCPLAYYTDYILLARNQEPYEILK